MTEEHIITAAVVTSGEKGHGPELPALLEDSQENIIEVDTNHWRRSLLRKGKP